MLHDTRRELSPLRRDGRQAIVGLVVLVSLLVALFHAHDLQVAQGDGATRVSAVAQVAGEGVACTLCTLIGGAVVAASLALLGCALQVAIVHEVCQRPLRWLALERSRARAPPTPFAA